MLHLLVKFAMATKSTTSEVEAFLDMNGYTDNVEVEHDGDERVMVVFEESLDFEECKEVMEDLVDSGSHLGEEDDYAVNVVSEDDKAFAVL